VAPRSRRSRCLRAAFWLALAAAGLLLVTRPAAGKQGRDQAAVPALLLVRLKLYGKAPVSG
jgi:hypothetical protein